MADEKTEKAKNHVQKQFSSVIITLENCTIPTERFYPTPSGQDGLDLETETDLRILGCEFIQTAGILLKLPQVAMATGQVLFQRFYYSKSFVKHNMEVVAMACINLASKIEEAPRRIRDVINVFHHIRQKRNGRNPEPMVLDAKYINMKNHVIKAERRVLKELGFCVHVKHPHKMIVTYLQFLECERNAQLIQTAWNYMNDSLKTDVFVRFPPETIACACIYLTARQLEIALPSNPPWYGLMGASTDELEDIALTILRLYTRPKKSYEELDKIVEKRRSAMQELKVKGKGQPEVASMGGTPNNFSPHSSRPNSPKPTTESPLLTKAANKLKEEPKSTGSGNSTKSSRDRNGHSKNKHRQGGGSHSDSDIQSISPSPRRSHSRSRSRSDHRSSRGSSTSRSRSRSRSYSSHDDNSYSGHSKHRRKDDHKRRTGNKNKGGRMRKRKRSFSRSRSVSRSRSRSPPRRHKHRYSPYRDNRKGKLRSRSRSRERSHKVPKRDSGRRRSRSRSHSKDGRRRR